MTNDLFTLGCWLIIILIRSIYLLILIGITFKDSGFSRANVNETTRSYNSAKLLSDVLLVAAALWFWSNMGLSILCYFVIVMAMVTLDPDHVRNGNISNNFLGFRYIIGSVWLWSHKEQVFVVSIVAFFTYVFIIALRDNDITRGPPATQVFRSTSSSGGGGGSNSGIMVGPSQGLRRVVVGGNVILGDGEQHIEGVRVGGFSLKLHIEKCRDVFIGSISWLSRRI